MPLEKDIKQKTFKNPYNRLTINIMFTSGWLLTRTSKILKPYGLSEQQFSVLKILRQHHPETLNINLIMAGMINRMSNTSRLVDKLVTKNLVRKVDSLHDLRSTYVELTAKGLALIDELNIIIGNYENGSTGLNLEEVELLNNLLTKIKKNDS